MFKSSISHSPATHVAGAAAVQKQTRKGDSERPPTSDEAGRAPSSHYEALVILTVVVIAAVDDPITAVYALTLARFGTIPSLGGTLPLAPLRCGIGVFNGEIYFKLFPGRCLAAGGARWWDARLPP